MEYGILILGVFALVAVLVYGANDQARTNVMGDIRAEARKALYQSDKTLVDINNIIQAMDANTLAMKRQTTEIDFLTVRQRTLEKKIISTERTVNVNILEKALPKGLGKAALIK